VAGFAAELAAQHNARLVLQHVIRPQERAEVLAGRSIDQIETDLLSLVPRDLHNKIAVQTIVVPGDPTEELLYQCRAQQADLIVLGAQGASAFAAVTRHGVVYKVLAHALCPSSPCRRSCWPRAAPKPISSVPPRLISPALFRRNPGGSFPAEGSTPGNPGPPVCLAPWPGVTHPADAVCRPACGPIVFYHPIRSSLYVWSRHRAATPAVALWSPWLRRAKPATVGSGAAIRRHHP